MVQRLKTDVSTSRSNRGKLYGRRGSKRNKIQRAQWFYSQETFGNISSCFDVNSLSET